jgi:hypothetical protein
MAVRLTALRAGRPLPPRKFPGTHFCWKLIRPQGHSATGKIGSIKESIDFIGNRTHDVPACSIVSQPTKLLRAPLIGSSIRNIGVGALGDQMLAQRGHVAWSRTKAGLPNRNRIFYQGKTVMVSHIGESVCVCVCVCVCVQCLHQFF